MVTQCERGECRELSSEFGELFVRVVGDVHFVEKCQSVAPTAWRARLSPQELMATMEWIESTMQFSLARLRFLRPLYELLDVALHAPSWSTARIAVCLTLDGLSVLPSLSLPGVSMVSFVTIVSVTMFVSTALALLWPAEPSRTLFDVARQLDGDDQASVGRVLSGNEALIGEDGLASDGEAEA
jgi:hypothetical protein